MKYRVDNKKVDEWDMLRIKAELSKQPVFKGEEEKPSRKTIWFCLLTIPLILLAVFYFK